MPAAQIDGFSGDPNFMTSLARGLAVIQAFSTRRDPLTISLCQQQDRVFARRCTPLPLHARPTWLCGIG